MTENKKIRNASPTSFDNINFKSTIERTIYKALIEQGINPQYEAITYVLSKGIRPYKVPYYTRRKGRATKLYKLTLDMSPVSEITYTPDFTFELNGVFVILEVKGWVNDIFPVKRNLFRKYLEGLDKPIMFFEIRSKRELLRALEIVRMETKQISDIRKLCAKLPEKDVSVANRMLEERDFKSLGHLVYLDILKIEKSRRKQEERYANIDLDSLYLLMTKLTDITIREDIA
jgi:hypothetical protein